MHVCNIVYEYMAVYSKVSDMPKQAYKNIESAYVMAWCVCACVCTSTPLVAHTD